MDVTGSQLLWEACRQPTVSTDATLPPTFLGQLHGAELPRRESARIAGRFCREHDAVYRPHPEERDLLSRMQHAAWERRGIRLYRSAATLDELRSSVVATFSTGVLEAAAMGLDAFVHHPEPPRWLQDLWHRYRLQRWETGAATERPPQPTEEPAQRIALIITEATRPAAP